MDCMVEYLTETLKSADLDTVTKADLKKKYMKEKGLDTWTKEDKQLFSSAFNQVLETYRNTMKEVNSSDSESELQEIFEKGDTNSTEQFVNSRDKFKRKLSTSSSEDEDIQQTKKNRRKKKQARVVSDEESESLKAVEELKLSKSPSSLNAKKDANAKGKKRKLSGETLERKTKKAHVISSDSEEETSNKVSKKFSIDSDDDSLGALVFSGSEDGHQTEQKCEEKLKCKKGSKEDSDSSCSENKLLHIKERGPKEELSTVCAKKDLSDSEEEPLANFSKRNSVDSKDEVVAKHTKKDSSDSEDEPIGNLSKRNSVDSKDEAVAKHIEKDSSDSENEAVAKLTTDSSDSEDEPIANLSIRNSVDSKDKSVAKHIEKDSSDSEDVPLAKITKKDSSDSEDESIAKFAKKDSSDSEDESHSKLKKDSSDSENEPLNQLKKKDSSDSEDESLAEVAKKNKKNSESKRKSALLSDSEDDSIVRKTSRKSKDRSSSSKRTPLKKKKDAESKISKSPGEKDGGSSDEADEISEESKSKEKKDSKQKVKPSEKKLDLLKKYVRAAGIRVPSYIKLFEKCKSMKSKHQKLMDLLEENGMKGRPTIAKCKILKVKIETQKEVAELDTSKIISAKGRPKRNACADVSNRKDDLEKVATPVKVFSRLKGIVDSD